MVKTGVMLSNSLIFLASRARMLPDGTIFFSAKYSVSSTSKEFGWVITRLVTSSVVAVMYSILMPVSFRHCLEISSPSFTAVPR
ncbi:hypothetical protein ACVWWO_001518 [Bradyrhizobium sp. F1.13.1]